MSKTRASLGIFKDTPITESIDTTSKRPDRVGRTAMPFWVPIAARKQLRVMAAEMDSTMQELMTIALNDFFSKHGKPPIA